MPILVVITAPEHAAPLVRWGMRFAAARGSSLALLAVQQGRQESPLERVPFSRAEGEEEEDLLVKALRAAIAAAHQLEPASSVSSAAIMAPVIRRLRHPRPTEPILALQRELSAGLLVVGMRAPHHEQHGQVDLGRALMAAAPCDVMLLRTLGDPARDQGRVLVPVSGGPHAKVALRLGAQLAAIHRGSCTALYVSPAAGTEATEVGEHHLRAAMRSAGVGEDAGVSAKVVLGRDVRKAISEVSEEGFDLVIVGASEHGAVSRLLFGTIAERLLTHDEPVSVGVIRRADPLHARLWIRVTGWTQARLPQLTREERVELSDRLLGGSRTGFDFLAMIVLSTGIAGLGLIQNSIAVVVGGMLVAPLMTPIVGAGLALVQGNVVLVKECARSIAYGFCAAFAVGLLLGLLTPIVRLTPELLARGGPNLLDLGVAFISGLAGAYALARPNLSAALPGVAIAAALVPPIAAVGISLAIGEIANARGAVLLFGTNVVAIILGSALALYAVGLRPAQGRPWPLWGRRLVGGLLGTLAILAVPLSMVAAASWQRPERPVGPELRQRVVAVAQEHGASVTGINWDQIEDGTQLLVELQAAVPPPADIASRIAHAAGEHLDPQRPVRVRTDLVSEASASE